MTAFDGFTPITIEKYELQTEMPVHWIDAEFIPVDKLFPHWMTAKPILTDFVQRTKDWAVSSVNGDSSNIAIGLEFPNVWDEISGPVIGICHTLMADYIPDLRRYKGQKVTEATFASIKMEIRSRESYIVSLGGRPVKAELAFRLGLWGWE